MAKSKSKKSQMFKCEHCPKEYSRKDALKRHVASKHEDKIETKIGSTDGGGNAITPQQEKFCLLYASDAELFGNGVQSYISAYDIKVGRGKGYTTYETCKYMAHRLLQNKKILHRINEIFAGRGLNDEFVDKQLEFVITQSAELNPKMKGIVEYNKLKKRTTDTVRHVHAHSDVTAMSDEELAAEEARLEKFFAKA